MATARIYYSSVSTGTRYEPKNWFKLREYYRGRDIELPTQLGFRLGIVLKCPNCDSRLILRSRKSDNTPFWGCINFPPCCGTVDIPKDCAEEAKHWVGLRSCLTEGEAIEADKEYNLFRSQMGLGPIGILFAEAPFESSVKETSVKEATPSKSNVEVLEAIHRFSVRLTLLQFEKLTPQNTDKLEKLLQEAKSLLAAYTKASTDGDMRCMPYLMHDLEAIVRKGQAWLNSDKNSPPPPKEDSKAKMQTRTKMQASKPHPDSDELVSGEDSDSDSEDCGEKDEMVKTEAEPDMSVYRKGRKKRYEDADAGDSEWKPKPKSMGEDMIDRLKSSAKKAPARVVRMQALEQGRELILAALQTRLDPSAFSMAKTFFDSDAGQGAVIGLIGLIGPQVPKLGEDPRVQMVCEEFLDEGVAKGMNQVTSFMTGLLKPVIEAMVEKMPPVSEVVETVKHKRATKKSGKKRVAASTVRELVEEEHEEQAAHGFAGRVPS